MAERWPVAAGKAELSPKSKRPPFSQAAFLASASPTTARPVPAGEVYTGSQDKIDRAICEFHVGNLYINRKCTGAMVGAHPFGGFQQVRNRLKSRRGGLLVPVHSGQVCGRKDQVVFLRAVSEGCVVRRNAPDANADRSGLKAPQQKNPLHRERASALMKTFYWPGQTLGSSFWKLSHLFAESLLGAPK
jgi:hypothetical protein